MKAVLDLPEAHTRALKVVLERVPPEEVCWVLTGSAGLRLQGVDLPVHDLDLQSDGESVYLIERRLAEFVKTPIHLWETARMRSLDGKAEIDGIQVELLADIAHLLPDGTWSGFTDFSRLVWLDWSGQRVPVFPLADEAEAYASMGRLEKAARIRAFLAGLPPS
jgi:hypothetical protein